MDLKQGQVVCLEAGSFKGYLATILEIHSNYVDVEVELFGRKTPISVSMHELGTSSKTRSMTSRIEEFDRLYKQSAPLRYAQLNEGIARNEIERLRPQLQAAHIPEAYIDLYTWKNGMRPAKGWNSEFEADCLYELLPLDNVGHFVSLNRAISLIRMWENIMSAATSRGEYCHWRRGFLPLLEMQSYGLVIIDTLGYFPGGKPNQLVFFDYKCANGYSIIHESIETWMETNIVLLKEKLFFKKECTERVHFIKRTCDPFAYQFIGRQFLLE